MGHRPILQAICSTERKGFSIMDNVWVMLVLSLVSGLIGAISTMVFYIRREDRKYKIDTIKRFVANRHDLQGDEFTRALNEIFVVFNKSDAVLSELQNFHDVICSQQKTNKTNDVLMSLFKTMCDDVKLNYPLNDSFFPTPFNTKKNCSVLPDARN